MIEIDGLYAGISQEAFGEIRKYFTCKDLSNNLETEESQILTLSIENCTNIG